MHMSAGFPSLPILLSMTETASLLKVSYRTLKRMIARREISCIRGCRGRRNLFTEAAIARYLAKREQPADES